ncbi:MAG: hypothetical protein ABW186_01115 [Rhodanobacteraceae bacterium]
MIDVRAQMRRRIARHRWAGCCANDFGEREQRILHRTRLRFVRRSEINPQPDRAIVRAAVRGSTPAA